MIKNGDTIIDCGAYTGDTAQEFLSRADIKEIIAVEGMTINFSKLKELSSSLNGKRIRPINVFLSEKEEIVSVPQLHDQSDIDPRYKIKTKTNYKNENAVPLDSLIQNDKVDLIKIDVEGADLSVLKGATRIILKDKPSLIVSSYHENNHIWQVPETIQKLESKYKIYAGHHHKCVYEIEYYAVI
jgi:FkbM family methyltransferase